LEKLPTIVEDIMSSPVITVDGETTVRDAALLMREKGIGSVVVVERGRPPGIVTERDLLERVVAPCRDPCEVRVKEVMSSPLITIESDESILEAMRRMRERGIRRLIVMEGGEMVGVVSSRDIMVGLSIAALTSFSALLRRR
jgi:CBS domain-containing protein